MNDNLISEATAIILWNDVPSGIPGDDVAVFAAHDRRVDDRGLADRFDNSAGAFMADWLKEPRANARAVFDDFMAGEYIRSLTDDFWHDVHSAWLTEMAKIKECDWARRMLLAAQQGGAA